MAMIMMVLIGFFVGVLAKFLMPGKDKGGFLLTALLGIGGSVFATFLGQTLGWYMYGEPAGFIASVLGAVLILTLVRAVRG